MAEGDLLEFEEAMAHFSSMFPCVRRQEIEGVLRRCDGDIAATVDELLARQTAQKCGVESPVATVSPASLSNHPLAEIYREAHASNQSELIESASRGSQVRLADRRSTMSVDDLCRETAILRHKMNENGRRLDLVNDEREARMLEDEQIALMLQNREFVSYLKRDPHFLREIGVSHSGGSRPPRPCSPPRKTSRGHAHGPRVPDGPVLEGGVPNGPIVDGVHCVKQGMASKLRSRLRLSSASGSGSGGAYAAANRQQECFDSVGADPFPYTVCVEREESGDIRDRLKTMSRASKARLSSLARRFRGDAKTIESYPNASFGMDPRNGY